MQRKRHIRSTTDCLCPAMTWRRNLHFKVKSFGLNLVFRYLASTVKNDRQVSRVLSGEPCMPEDGSIFTLSLWAVVVGG